MNFIEILLDWIFPTPRLSAEEMYHQATKSEPYIHETITSVFSYKDPLIQKAIWELKYRGNRYNARIFGDILAQALMEKLADEYLFSNTEQFIIIPLPLSQKRQKERGWNQSLMVAKEIVQHFHAHEIILGDKFLIKIRHTIPQTMLSKKERQENLKDCFEVPEKYKKEIEDKTIILIDDVTTTGSTILEAAKTLHAAGTRRVWGFTVAH